MPAPALALVSRDTDGFHLTLTNNDAAGANFTIEINRAADFASDDTLVAFVAGAAAGANAVTFNGLPGATPFYMRARNQVAASPYSGVLFAATAVTAFDTTYAGYAVAKAHLIVPSDFSIVAVSLGGDTVLRPGFPVENMQIDDPQATFQATATTLLSVAVEFITSGEPIDTIAILGTMINDAMLWNLKSAPGPTDDFITRKDFSAFRVSPTIGYRRSYHGIYRLPVPLTDRRWRFEFYGFGRQFLARNMIVGLTRESINAEAGSGQAMIDQSTVQRTRFGGLDSVTGWMGRSLDFSLAWLSEAEYHTKWSMLPTLVGKRTPVLIMPNSKRGPFLQDNIGYGPITGMRAAVVRGDKHSQQIEIDSIY